MVTETRPIDEAKLMAFIDKVVTDFGATFSAGLVVLGDKLGIYRTMAGAGSMTATDPLGHVTAYTYDGHGNRLTAWACPGLVDS